MTTNYKAEIVQGLVGHLRANTTVSALVGARVYHTAAPEAGPDGTLPKALPMVMVERIPGGPKATTMTGDQGWTMDRIQITCWADGAEKAHQVFGAVYSVLSGFRGTLSGMVGQVEVDHVLFTESPHPVYDDNRPAHGARADASVAHMGL